MKAVTLDEAIRERLAERQHEREEAEAREQARLEEIARQEAQIERLMPAWLVEQEGIETEAADWLAQAVSNIDVDPVRFRVQWQDSESDRAVTATSDFRFAGEGVAVVEDYDHALALWASGAGCTTRLFDRFVDAVIYARGLDV